MVPWFLSKFSMVIGSKYEINESRFVIIIQQNIIQVHCKGHYFNLCIMACFQVEIWSIFFLSPVFPHKHSVCKSFHVNFYNFLIQCQFIKRYVLTGRLFYLCFFNFCARKLLLLHRKSVLTIRGKCMWVENHHGNDYKGSRFENVLIMVFQFFIIEQNNQCHDAYDNNLQPAPDMLCVGMLQFSFTDFQMLFNLSIFSKYSLLVCGKRKNQSLRTYRTITNKCAKFL
jgi:hypothetical protein